MLVGVVTAGMDVAACRWDGGLLAEGSEEWTPSRGRHAADGNGGFDHGPERYVLFWERESVMAQSDGAQETLDIGYLLLSRT